MSSQFSAFGITTRTPNSNTSGQNTENNNHHNNMGLHNHIMNPFRSNNSITTTTTTTTTTTMDNNNNNDNSNNNNNNSNSNNFNINNNVQLPISLSLNNNNNNNNNNIHQSSQNNLIESLGPFYHNNNNSSSNSNNLNNNNSSTANNTILKNLRHYIYGADNNNNSLSSSTASSTSSPSNNNNNTSNLDNNLSLDLPDDVHLPSPLPREELNKRKNKYGLFSIRLTPYIDNTHNHNNNNNLNDNNPSMNSGHGLFFEPIIRTAGPGSQLVIGRYTERVREAISKLPEQYHPVVFKSKVISRAHGCFKVDSQGNWFIKDVKSSSGTFLNHQRLSPASTLSKDYLLHDGDILQLGMDFRGGIEEIYKCVKMKVELNRSWKRKANKFDKEALQRIRNLQKLINDGVEEEDCSICLSKIKPCQAIFISPCSHSWHFHCIRRLIMISYPQFVCPNCRSTCDLEANLSESEDDMDDYVEGEEANESQEQEQNENENGNNHIPPNNPITNNTAITTTSNTTSTTTNNNNTNNNKSNTVVAQPFSNNEEISSMYDINMS